LMDHCQTEGLDSPGVAIRMEASKCPKCGDEPHFIETVEKWYCYGCNSYIDNEEPLNGQVSSAVGAEQSADASEDEVASVKEADSRICSTCGAELEHIKDGKLYCYVCETYADDAKEEPRPVAEAGAQRAAPAHTEDEKLANDAKALLDSIPEPSAVEMPTKPMLDSRLELVATPVSEPKVEKRVEVKMCSTCGQPLKWIEKYQRNYCYGCRKYASKDGAAAPEPQGKQGDDGHKNCPICDAELKFIEKYKEYYCFACKKYPLRQKSPSGRSKTPDACPKCGGSLRYIEKYQRYYCFACKEYAPKGHGHGSAEKKVCPTCKSEMKYVSEYNEWYCYTCKKYSLRPAKPVLLF
jgi:uncharacterized Zn finger protein (UPF0148 family)